MPKRLRLIASDKRHEQFAFFFDSLCKGKVHRSAHRLYTCRRRLKPAQAFCVPLFEVFKNLRVGRRFADLVIALAGFGVAGVAGDLSGKRNRVRIERPFAGKPVNEPDIRSLFGADGIAGDDHLQRIRNAYHARKALRSAGARQNTKLDFR